MLEHVNCSTICIWGQAPCSQNETPNKKWRAHVVYAGQLREKIIIGNLRELWLLQQQILQGHAEKSTLVFSHLLDD